MGQTGLDITLSLQWFSSQVLQHALRNPKHEELKIDNCIALHYVMGKSGPEVETTETTPKAPMVSC